MRARALPIVLAALALLVGCGGGEDEGTTQSPATTPSKASLPLEAAIRQSFPKPKPDPGVEGSAEAIEAGEDACDGMTPKQVLHEFIPSARLSPDQRQAVEQLPTAEAHPTADFVAGQLAALAYEGTLRGESAAFGYQGCVYALARAQG